MGKYNGREIYIESLNLSVRSYNCLKKNNIDTLDKLLVLDEYELFKLKNLGKKSLEEIKNVISKQYKGELEFNYGKDSTILDKIADKEKQIQEVLFKGENQVYVDDIEIDNMNLSVRSKNALKRNGYYKASEVVQLKLGFLDEIKNLGEKSKKEIIDNLKAITHIQYVEKINNSKESIANLTNIFIDEYSESLVKFSKTTLKRNIYLGLNENVNDLDSSYKDLKYLVNNEDIIKKIYDCRFLKELIKNHIIKFIGDKDEMITLSEIRDTLPNHLKCSIVFKIIMSNLITDKNIELLEGKYRIYYQSLNEYIDSIKDYRYKIIFKKRLEGKTLESIALELNITRERVRQIEKKIMERIPKVREDYYKIIFEKYNWDEESFRYCYNEPYTTYRYLKSKYNKGIKDLELMLEDQSIDVKIRIKAEKIIFKDYIVIGSSRIKKERNDILNYILRTFCKDEVSSEELSDLYYMFLEDYGLNEIGNLQYPNRYFETTLANSKKVLWKYGKKLRFYDFEYLDADIIYNNLHLDRLQNVEYSTLKLFNDYKDIMKEWDIRDEYELHNLIKKVFTDKNEYNIKIARMPNLEFGNPDRDMQVLDLLLQMAPVDNYILAKKYELVYGVKSETVLANYFKCIDEFLHEGVYSIDFELLPNEEFEKMKEVLTDDIYVVNDIKKIYKDLFPEGNLKLINTHNLKRLGFKVNTDIIYSDKFISAESYFRKLILEKDIFDSTLLDSALSTSQTYYVALQSLRTQFEVIEFSQNMFINIRRLKQKGIVKEKLLEYIDRVYEFVGFDIFTIKSLRMKGFEHELDDLGFEDWFYSSILTSDSRFRFRKLNGNILLCVGRDNVALADLVEHIVSNHRKIDIYDLVDYIKYEYGIKVERQKIQQIAKERDLYYDSIMEKVYIDYDEYFEEV
ncbi:MAG: DNA-directed RNA polymerase subunit alpha C-terminal domain-containing protein [Paeniclostridium sordellii]|nr:DNA-directed RNA polymerase subunit alpha C-terminal domain-containing protein [Paeniclostridium sordellii]